MEIQVHLGNLFLGMGLVSVAWGIVSMIAITSFVSERGTKINLLLYRLYIFKYIEQYKQITQVENGEPGPWFYSFLISMNMTLVLVVVGAILKST